MTAPALNVRIRRVVVDAAVLEGTAPQDLHTQLETEIAHATAGMAVDGPPTLARRIASGLLPQVNARLPSDMKGEDHGNR